MLQKGVVGEFFRPDQPAEFFSHDSDDVRAVDESQEFLHFRRKENCGAGDVHNLDAPDNVETVDSSRSLIDLPLGGIPADPRPPGFPSRLESAR